MRVLKVPMIGQAISHYLIVEKIGQGGMGEVYRATDTKLNRQVALKVLSEAFVGDTQRMAQFKREAQILASFSHQNIAAIHGLEEADGKRALVMELVKGEDLSQRLARGAIPEKEALELALQVAEALEAAHERGIVHRDLKPANIKITPKGVVKVLDFGLAKAIEPEQTPEGMASSPTLTTAATRVGVILGTARYMSPEQARGQPVDRRTDIWAFGCVLFEMLSGRKAFFGEFVSDVLASILKTDPDFRSLPSSLDFRIEKLLRRCLQKDYRQRVQAIGDVRLEIEEVLATPGRARPVAARRTGLGRWVPPWAVTLVAAALAAAAVWTWKPPPAEVPEPITRFSVVPPKRAPLWVSPAHPDLAISPDGRNLAYIAGDRNRREIYVRPVDQIQATRILACQGQCGGPFFSPDGREIAFGVPGELRKVSLRGGLSRSICTVGGNGIYQGATWGANGTIIFGDGGRGLSIVSAEGGKPRELTTPEAERGEKDHAWPELLPGGEAVLFTVLAAQGRELAVLDLAASTYRVLGLSGSNHRYSSTGHILYALEGAVWAVPYDLTRGELTGEPGLVLRDVNNKKVNGAPNFGLSNQGSLVYVPSRLRNPRLVWVDLEGQERELDVEPAVFRNPALSPDGSRLAVGVLDRSYMAWDLWIYDLSRGNQTRLTRGPSNDIVPHWTPDGEWIVFASNRTDSMYSLYRIRADGTGQVERVAGGSNNIYPDSLSADGKTLVFNENTGGNANIGWVSLDGTSDPRPLLQTETDEMHPAVSPDGRWIVYESNESGQSEIYVRPFPAVEGWRTTISSGGGTVPLWAPDGRKLFYWKGSRLMSVSIETEPGFTHGTPEILFERGYSPGDCAIHPDGRRFLMIKESPQPEESLPPAEIVWVQNWWEDLRRLVPAVP